MGTREAINQYYSNMRFHTRYDTGNNISLRLCIIKNVDAKNLVADIFIPGDSANYFDIPLLMPFLSDKSGAIFLPKKDSPALSITTSEGKRYVLTSLATFNNGHDTFVESGENKIFNEGGSFFKQDASGGNIFMSGKSATRTLIDAAEKSYCLSSTIVSSVERKYSGTTNIKSGENTRLLNYTEISSGVVKSHKYEEEDLIVHDSGDIINLNNDIRNEILLKNKENAGNVIGFIKDIREFKDKIFINPYMDKLDRNELITNTKESLKSKYSQKKNISIIKEEGMAINKRISSESEIASLTSDDIELTSEGKNIAFRVRMYNNDNNIASIVIDEDGVVKLKCKDFIIEKEVL